MKIFNKFIWSKKEPSNKNDIWFDGSTWRMYTEEAWQSFTLPIDAADTLTKMLENASEVYQEKLNAGYGIIIEGNTISVDDSILYDDSDVWEAIETLQQNKVEQTQLNEYVPLDRYASTAQVLMENINELDSIKLNKTDVATINGKSLIEGGNIVIPTGGESYDDTEIKQQITELSVEIDEISNGKKKDLTLEVWYNGEYVAYDSTFLTSNSAYDLFGPLYLKKGDTIVYKTLCSAAIAELSKVNDHSSSSPSFIPLVKGRSSYASEYSYIIEEDGYYVLSGRDAASYPAYVTTAYVIEKGIVAKVEDLESEVAELRSATSIHDVLFGKKYVACGDSFTAYTNAKFESGIYQGRDKTYPYLIGLRTGMDVNNMAVSGMSLVKKDGSDNYFSGNYFKGIPSDADYITIKLGINDVNYGSPIGTINDSDNTTFYGAWNVVMSYLIANYPYAKIGIIVTNGASDEVMEAERAIAKKWGVPFLDYGDYQTPLMGRMSGFRDGVVSEAIQARHNAFRISDTDTHPNAKAHEYESTFIEAFLRRL